MNEFTNPEIEKTVLGYLCYLCNPQDELLMNAMDRLHVDCFTGIDRTRLFSIMVNNHVKGLPISLGDLVPYLDDKFLFIINDCLDSKANHETADHWITELNNLRIDRKTKKLLDETINQYESFETREDRREVIDEFQNKILEIEDADIYADRNVLNSVDACKEFRLSKALGFRIVSSGIKDLDNLLEGGFRPGQLIVIGAPSSTGKTHIGLKILWECHKLQQDTESVVFSLEASRDEVIERLITHAANRPYQHLTDEDKIKFETIYSKSNISICDKSPVSVDFIRSYCKRARLKNPLSVIFVDYLDRVQKPKGNDRTDEKLSMIAESLANLAKDFGCLVILTTQLSKEAIRRASRRPEMSDSKNTNGTAECASYWFGLKRINQWDGERKYEDSDLIELILDKNRYGQQGIVWFRNFNNTYQEINQLEASRKIAFSNLERKKDNKKSNKADDSDFSFLDRISE